MSRTIVLILILVSAAPFMAYSQSSTNNENTRSKNKNQEKGFSKTTKYEKEFKQIVDQINDLDNVGMSLRTARDTLKFFSKKLKDDPEVNFYLGQSYCLDCNVEPIELFEEEGITYADCYERTSRKCDSALKYLLLARQLWGYGIDRYNATSKILEAFATKYQIRTFVFHDSTVFGILRKAKEIGLLGDASIARAQNILSSCDKHAALFIADYEEFLAIKYVQFILARRADILTYFLPHFDAENFSLLCDDGQPLLPINITYDSLMSLEIDTNSPPKIFDYDQTEITVPKSVTTELEAELGLKSLDTVINLAILPQQPLEAALDRNFRQFSMHDLFIRFKWKRPIYFSTNGAYYLRTGMYSLRWEGLVARLLPVDSKIIREEILSESGLWLDSLKLKRSIVHYDLFQNSLKDSVTDPYSVWRTYLELLSVSRLEYRNESRFWREVYQSIPPLPQSCIEDSSFYSYSLVREYYRWGLKKQARKLSSLIYPTLNKRIAVNPNDSSLKGILLYHYLTNEDCDSVRQLLDMNPNLTTLHRLFLMINDDYGCKEIPESTKVIKKQMEIEFKKYWEELKEEYEREEHERRYNEKGTKL